MEQQSNAISVIPPLSQSMESTAACPRGYVSIFIEGKTQPDSIPSERGSDIHHVTSEYIRHCAEHQIPADYAKRDELAARSGPVAGPILDRFLQNYVVDFAHVYGTEMVMALDEDFSPAYFWVDEHGEVQTDYRGNHIERIPGVEYSEKPAALIGVLDLLLINGDEGEVDDHKSQFDIMDEDTFQGTLYSYFVLTHFPNLRKVKFQLQFVRYSKCFRSTTWLREDMPEMQRVISRARERQLVTHAIPDDAQALPCQICAYCPLAKDKTCPISEWNEHLILTPVQRLIRSEWHRRMRALDMPILKAQAIANGPVVYVDGNGRSYTYGEHEVPETKIPLDNTSLGLLLEWAERKGENLLDGRLSISSTKLKSLLKTNKREQLREQFEESVYQTTTKPQFRVRTADEGTILEQYDQDYNED